MKCNGGNGPGSGPPGPGLGSFCLLLIGKLNTSFDSFFWKGFGLISLISPLYIDKFLITLLLLLNLLFLHVKAGKEISGLILVLYLLLFGFF